MKHIRSQYTDDINFFGPTSPQALAEKYGTPLYVYNEKILRERCRELMGLSSHEGFGVNYSVKANSNPALLKIIREEGATVDAMSPGELAMDKLAGYESGDILYISNNIDAAEMQAALDAGCLMSMDSLSQLETLGQLAPKSRVMARVNPGIGEGHHAKVVTGGANSKFGVNPSQLPELLSILKKYDLKLVGLNQHIGSLFMKPDSYIEAAQILLQIAEKLPAPLFRNLEILDFGGGFGIPYHKFEHEERLDMKALGAALHQLLDYWSAAANYGGQFLVEPGRYVTAECGLLLGKVTAIKNNGDTRYVGTNIGFNVLQRPMLYDAFHDIEIYAPDRPHEEIRQTVVGNICESGDIIAKDRLLPEMREGDLLGILDAGAYGFSMASNYNQRLLPAEVLIRESGDILLIRRRQTINDLEACLANFQ